MRVVTGLIRGVSLGAFLATGAAAWGAGWIAFTAPDIDRTRAVFQELQRRAKPDLDRHGLELRFVSLPVNDGPDADAIIAKAVSERPAIVIAPATRTAQSVRKASATVPLVFASVADPVRAGLVESLARPGGLATGFTYDVFVEGKQLELLAEIAPKARVIGVLEDGHWLGERVTETQLRQFEQALGRSIRVFRAPDRESLIATLQSRDARAVDAWLVPISNSAGERKADVVAELRKQRKPAVYGRGFFVDAGGLAAYQEVIPDPVGIWVGMLQAILAGTPLASIPVQRPMEFELSLNARAAREIGVDLPPTLLRRAHRVVRDAGT